MLENFIIYTVQCTLICQTKKIHNVQFISAENFLSLSELIYTILLYLKGYPYYNRKATACCYAVYTSKVCLSSYWYQQTFFLC